MWRADEHSRIRKTGEPLTSSHTCWYMASMSSLRLALRTPLPPPPSEALIMIGYPTRSATSSASAADRTHALSNTSSDTATRPSASASTITPEPDHETHGTCADWAMIVEAILSPRRNMELSVGPMKTMPSSSHVRGSAGFSDAWPQPGHTASALCSLAIEVITLTLA